MMLGLGADAAASSTGTGTGTGGTAPTSATLPGFTDGLKLWTTPGTAVTVLTTAVQNPTAALASAIMPFTIGVLAVPILAVLAVMSMNDKRGG